MKLSSSQNRSRASQDHILAPRKKRQFFPYFALILQKKSKRILRLNFRLMQTCFYEKKAGLIITTIVAGAYNAFPEKTVAALTLSAKACRARTGLWYRKHQHYDYGIFLNNSLLLSIHCQCCSSRKVFVVAVFGRSGEDLRSLLKIKVSEK